MDEQDCRLNNHKAHFSILINHICLYKNSGWTLDLKKTTTFFHNIKSIFWSVNPRGKRPQHCRCSDGLLKRVSPWRNFGNGPWSRVGGSWECVSDRGRGAGQALQLLADSLVILRTTNPSRNDQEQQPFDTQDFPLRKHITARARRFTCTLSWKTGDCMSRGLPTPMQLPSESDVSSSCKDSAEFVLPDFTKDGEITGRGKESVSNITARGLYPRRLSAWQARGEKDCDALNMVSEAKNILLHNQSVVCRSSPAAGGLWMISDSVYPPELSERRRGFFLALIFAFFNRISLHRFKRKETYFSDLPLKLESLTSQMIWEAPTWYNIFEFTCLQDWSNSASDLELNTGSNTSSSYILRSGAAGYGVMILFCMAGIYKR